MKIRNKKCTWALSLFKPILKVPSFDDITANDTAWHFTRVFPNALIRWLAVTDKLRLAFRLLPTYRDQ